MSSLAGQSCLYVGYVVHRRFRPRTHSFRYRLFMVYLDLAELDEVFTGRWLWSTKRWALAWFRRADHWGDPNLPLDTCVRDLVQQQTGRRPQGPIRLLTHLRYCGYCFNPISIYYCFSEDAKHIEAIVAEVTNTPWREQHCYVLDSSQYSNRQPADQTPVDRRYEYQFSKALHVSPFMPMALDYAWRCNEPGHRLAVHMDVLKAGQKVLDATLALQRCPMNGTNLARVLLRFPLMTLKVIAAIHWEALRLWLKQVPLFDHPSKADKPLES